MLTCDFKLLFGNSCMSRENSEEKKEKPSTLNQNEIENITNNVVDELERRVGTKNRFSVFIRNYSIELFSAVLIGFLVSVAASMFPQYFFFLNDTEEQVVFNTQHSISETAQSTNREFYVRAMLSNVLSGMVPTKMYFNQYIMATGELPKKASDVGSSISELQEIDYIEDSFLTKESGIGVLLSKEFGDNKILALLPEITPSGSRIKWKCKTNIDKKYLGIPKVAICKYSADLKNEKLSN